MCLTWELRLILWINCYPKPASISCLRRPLSFNSFSCSRKCSPLFSNWWSNSKLVLIFANSIDRYDTAVGGGAVVGMVLFTDRSVRSTKVVHFLKLIIVSPWIIMVSGWLRMMVAISWSELSENIVSRALYELPYDSHLDMGCKPHSTVSISHYSDRYGDPWSIEAFSIVFARWEINHLWSTEAAKS